MLLNKLLEYLRSLKLAHGLISNRNVLVQVINGFPAPERLPEAHRLDRRPTDIKPHSIGSHTHQ
jgi:hypothetical protein